MAPFLLAVATAALVCAGSAAAKTYALHETYDSSNFFDSDKFNFFESNFKSTNPNDVDPNSGFVNYYSKEKALASGLASQNGGEVYLGVDHHATSWTEGGRPSVRLESQKLYKKGLFIARFTHLPDNKCGTWPAFWMYGEGWPNGGEIDIYENFNNAEFNAPTFHTGKTQQVGVCNLDTTLSTGNIRRSSCDWEDTNSGCGVTDKRGPYATKGGGVFAMEWTDDFIRIFTWYNGLEPADIASDYPDTSTWGLPAAWLKNYNCPIDSHFVPQRLVLNIDFCGNAAGNPYLWSTMCKAETGVGNCNDYVRNNPSAFADVFFKVKDIRYFTESDGKPTTTKASSTSTTSSTKLTSASTSTSTSPTSTSSTRTSSTSTSSTSTSSTSISTTSISTTSISTTSISTTSTSSASSVLPTSSKQSSSSGSVSTSTTMLSSSTTISTKPTQTEQSTSASTSTSSATPTSTKQLTSASGSTSSDDTTSTKQTTVSLGSTSSVQSTSVRESSSTSSTSTTSAEPTTSKALTTLTSVQPTSIKESTATVSSDSISLGSTSSVKPSSAKSTNTSNMEDSTTTSLANTQKPTSGSSSSPATTSSQQPTSASTGSGGSISTSVLSQTSVSSATTGKNGTSSVTTSFDFLTSSVEMTTSTVYTTTIHTVSTCPPTVTNCPGGVHVTTEVIPAYTTVCPVSETTKSHTINVPVPSGETVTSKVTKIYTVTSCPPSVADCVIGKVTTELVSTVVCEGNCSGGSGPSQVIGVHSSMMTPVTSIVKTSSAAVCEGEKCQGTSPGENDKKPSSQGCDGSNCVSVVAATQTPSGSVCVGQECHELVNSGTRTVISAGAMVGSALILVLAL